MGLTYEIKDKTVDEIKGLYERGQINTSPIFQRKSVWKPKDRMKLINSILENNPVPSIFLYQREQNGKLIYDVIDGKQRLETILKYLEPRYKGIEGKISGEYKDDNLEVINIPEYKELTSTNRANVLKFTVGVIIVGGDYVDILKLFININSLGAPLKKQEIRNAKYIDSGIIKYVNDFIKKRSNEKYINYLSQIKNMDSQKNTRMNLEEFIIELIISIKTKTIHDGKTILDKVLSDKKEKVDAKTSKIFNDTIIWMKRMFPDEEIKTCRLSNKSDFYSLFYFFSNLVRDGYISTDEKINSLVKEILIGFYSKVDKAISKNTKNNQEDILSYKESIVRSTDSSQNRINRNMILIGLLQDLFKRKKDDKRLFSLIQKRILWNNSRDDIKCKKCNCNLSWEDISIDHIKPWSSGGKTDLNNAQILCQSCNSSKGNR